MTSPRSSYIMKKNGCTCPSDIQYPKKVVPIMKRTQRQDPFFDRQPPLSFLDDLTSPVHRTKPGHYGTSPIEPGEIDAHGLYIAEAYPEDPKGLLETIYDDFTRFADIYGIAGDTYPIRLCRGETECFEAYRVRITAEETTITAADTEGIRRGLVWLEDTLRRRENAFLTPGEVNRKPHIRARITRCFFSPINRPPKYGDELSDEIDYYPDEYLNRLMHDGTNGVWIYSRFSDLVPSSVLPSYGKGYEARIAKLNRVIEKCARYGIGVYLFAIEPYCLDPADAELCPALAGNRGWSGRNVFCVRSPEGKAFCREMGRKLLTLSPGLAGLISITYGERPTSCTSLYPNITCPHGNTDCLNQGAGAMLSEAVEALRSGVREVKPDCQVISWTYGHRTWQFDEIRDYVKTAPDDVMLMQNFDDMGYDTQLGEMRQCVDYWLSYTGPSDLFRITAEAAEEAGKHMYAKMQVCCSHEIASVPYIPVPGILYRKYAEARRLGVEGVMQCWYFGNYPSLMSKAAGELSFREDLVPGDAAAEEAFLTDLAAVFWGRSRAKAVAQMWKAFAEGYTRYPMNVMFSYYGPMHDAVVWKLALEPKNFSLPRSWQTLDPIDGDRICESLLNGHTLEEAIILTGQMCAAWKKGMAVLETLEADCPDAAEQISVAKALDLLLEGGHGILEFYHLRDLLGRKRGDCAGILAGMESIVQEQIRQSRAMISLCQADGRLGYHSEGEGYKFFPEKLTDRITQLEELLATEFPAVRQRIEAGKSPLPYYDGAEDWPELKRYTMPKGNLTDAPWKTIPDGKNSRFRMAYTDETLSIELQSDAPVPFTLCPEYCLMKPDATIHIAPDGTVKLGSLSKLYYSLFGARAEAELAKYRNIQTLSPSHHILTLSLGEIGLGKIRPMKMKLAAGGVQWCHAGEGSPTLGKSEVLPEDYGWIIPK